MNIIKIDNNVHLDQLMNNEPNKLYISSYKSIYDLKLLIINSFLKKNSLAKTKNYIRIWRLEERYDLGLFREYIYKNKSSILEEKSVIFPGYLFDSNYTIYFFSHSKFEARWGRIEREKRICGWIDLSKEQ